MTPKDSFLTNVWFWCILTINYTGLVPQPLDIFWIAISPLLVWTSRHFWRSGCLYLYLLRQLRRALTVGWIGPMNESHLITQFALAILRWLHAPFLSGLGELPRAFWRFQNECPRPMWGLQFTVCAHSPRLRLRISLLSLHNTDAYAFQAADLGRRVEDGPKWTAFCTSPPPRCPFAFAPRSFEGYEESVFFKNDPWWMDEFCLSGPKFTPISRSVPCIMFHASCQSMAWLFPSSHWTATIHCLRSFTSETFVHRALLTDFENFPDCLVLNFWRTYLHPNTATARL